MFSVLPGKFHSLWNAGPDAIVRSGPTPTGRAAGVASIDARRNPRRCQARRRGRIAADYLGDRSEGRIISPPGRAIPSGLGIIVRACWLAQFQGLDGDSADDRRYAVTPPGPVGLRRTRPTSSLGLAPLFMPVSPRYLSEASRHPSEAKSPPVLRVASKNGFGATVLPAHGLPTTLPGQASVPPNSRWLDRPAMLS